MVDLKLLSLYVGPDQVMPVMSFLAAAVGALLIFWGKLMGIVRRIFRLAPPPAESETTAPPASVKPDEKPKLD